MSRIVRRERTGGGTVPDPAVAAGLQSVLRCQSHAERTLAHSQTSDLGAIDDHLVTIGPARVTVRSLKLHGIADLESAPPRQLEAIHRALRVAREEGENMRHQVAETPDAFRREDTLVADDVDGLLRLEAGATQGRRRIEGTLTTCM